MKKVVAKNYKNVAAFHQKLRDSKRILAICGAGLSAASGLPTFRGPGGLWRNHKATELATPAAFARDPGLVWLFYAYRRHMALTAKPNAGHYALAALAKKHPDFLCLSQNVDNLHIRASHPPPNLHLLHGSLFALKCASPTCTYTDPCNTADPLCPSLSAACTGPTATADPDKPLPLLDPSVPLPSIPASTLPHCPECETGLVRPGVVWFGEALDEAVLDDAERWIAAAAVDLVLVIGTSSQVWPAAGYAEMARTKGRTSVVTINLDCDRDWFLRKLDKDDFAFQGDAAELLPMLLEPVIGKLEIPVE